MICTVIQCDKCDDFLISTRVTPKWLMEWIARRNGWTCGKQHLCQNCRKKKKEANGNELA
jgi:hypothetical protein